MSKRIKYLLAYHPASPLASKWKGILSGRKKVARSSSKNVPKSKRAVVRCCLFISHFSFGLEGGSGFFEDAEVFEAKRNENDEAGSKEGDHKGRRPVFLKHGYDSVETAEGKHNAGECGKEHIDVLFDGFALIDLGQFGMQPVNEDAENVV